MNIMRWANIFRGDNSKKETNIPKSNYFLLQTALVEGYRRRQALPYSICLGTLLGLMGMYTSYNHGVSEEYFIILTLYFLVVGFIFPFILLIGWQNLTQSGYEELFINKIGLEYIKKKKLRKNDIELIEKRAEIKSTSFIGRIAIGIIIISILLFLLGKGLPSTIELFILLVIISISFLYLLEIDRANLDKVIWQLCISYRLSTVIEKNKK